ncbi:MAG TPA: PD-(D/E)XK nuclease family protein, partial [Acidimicrobiia bacterium]|nr:PD-(D/E)XK nuclease family protein [Acidimicrobiia bacterium]
MAKVQPIVISHSELDAFRQCPHKHELAYKQRWVADVVSPALSTGRVWHVVMQEHYLAIQAEATEHTRRRAVAEILLAEQEADEERADLVAWMYDGYEERWGTDPQWEVLGVEDQRLIRLPTRTGRASRFWLRMRIDLLVRERLSAVGGPSSKVKTWVVDHKSGRDLPQERELALDDQFGLYTWGARTLGTPVFGSIYSAARTQRN